MFGAVVGIGSRLLPLVIRTGSRFASRSAMRSPNIGTANFRMRYGKLSPLAKRSVESLLSGGISTYGVSLLTPGRKRTTHIKHVYLKSSMPYGYRRSTYGRSYSRYSRYPRRYSSYRPMYRRRSYRRF